MRKSLLFVVTVTLVGCGSTGAIQQANSNAVVVIDRAGGFGDRGAAVASEHCSQYGKIAVFESATGPNIARRISYLCK